MKIILVLLALVSTQAHAETKYLQYQLNPSVVLVISSAKCPFPQINTEYPLAIAAFRVDGQKLAGCYKKYDEDMIEIQWKGGDKTVIPANAFLLKPIEAAPVPTL